MPAPVEIVHRRGTVAELHALDPFGERAVTGPQIWRCDPIDAAAVLGSRQDDDTLNADACAREGLNVVRRRSGGGLVVMQPESVAWIDVVLPHGLAPDDVRGSMVWVGEAWADAVADLDRGTERIAVHRGGMVDTPWSDLVCFAGLGPGEVLTGDRKLVGLSQRRTRRGVRVQALVHHVSLAALTAGVLAGDLPAEPLAEPAVRPGWSAATLATRLAASVARRVAAPTIVSTTPSATPRTTPL
ncbi:MAG: hypothetical protein QNJ12_15575 [Ilumatobacter sp.]|uniref:lipoyl protein ligase domain-containing protein n=1 Tax=Ilumatobacter sp. TaxID=1967498 RepID=UPI0026394AF7|nr:hypothetical protein [Ilumatobacter sp.]MDJ0770220.1 hypothetical protein [Ilumatobacter sp.]